MATAGVEEAFPDLSYEADLCGNIEQALKALQGYGVMALELIQNADDAHATKLQIDAREDELVINNDADFSRCSLAKNICDWSVQDAQSSNGLRTCNFHAITKMGGRSKLGSQDQIGRFGIGFVSVYQVTDTPIVRSVGVEYTLNPRDGRATRRSVEPATGTQFLLPWAFANSPVREAIHASVVPADVADKVVEAVAAILPSSVIFLRHLERIEVCRSGKIVASVDISRTAKGVDLLIEPGNVVQRWIVQSRDATDVIEKERLRERFPGLAELQRSPIVSVALPVEAEDQEGLIYAYLPTKKTTGLPLNINADFFPHASRQEIVLEGESQERFWNEAMLSAAAQIVGERFELLKSALGHRRLWSLGEASRLLAAKETAFACFWNVFSATAKSVESVWSLDGAWEKPALIRASPAVMTEAEQFALSSFGLRMLHPSQREYMNALGAVGVNILRVTDIATALAASGLAQIVPDNPNLRLLWSAINGMLEPVRGALSSVKGALAAPLKDIPYLLDWSGSAVSPAGAWRLPDNVPAELLKAVVPEIPVIHSDVGQHPHLLAQVQLFDLDDFARILAGMIPDEEAAVELFGGTDDRLRKTYRLFTLLWQEQNETRAAATLWDVPFLRKSDGHFLTPARALLPGEFVDPTGWFDFVDEAPFPPGMHRFAEVVLGVGVMSFPEFVGDHLEDAIERGMTMVQYQGLMAEIADHKHQLGDVFDVLSEAAFLRNRAGDFVRPRDCYFWDSALESVLGRNPSRWVDNAWLPSNSDTQNKLRDLLESKLGMPSGVAAEHIVERVRQVADEASPKQAKKELTPIFRHLLEGWARSDSTFRDELAGLADIVFLPAQLDGKPDESELYLPSDVYRAGRAPGFSTQVPVIDITPLRENRRAVNELLELIGVPEEPDTSVVVDHLISCMEVGRDPHPLTYQILGERCDRGDGHDEIDRLTDLPCIYDPARGYLKATRVFWSDPPFAHYWHKAHAKMQERQTLFNLLGVSICPEPSHYAELALELAATPASGVELSIHTRCIRFLADALWAGAEGAEEAVDELVGEESLLAISGAPIWPADALWKDSDHYLIPFRGDVDDVVVEPPSDCDVAALRRFYSRLQTPALSEMAGLELARDPDASVDEHATEVIRERSALLLRLAPTVEARSGLRRLLDGVTVRLAPTLLTRAELSLNGVTYRSEAVDTDVFVDRAEPAIYLAGTRVKWVLLARHLFDAIAPLCPNQDMRSLAGTAVPLLQAPTLEEAQEIMEELNFGEQLNEEDIPEGENLNEDADDWWSDGDEPEITDDSVSPDGGESDGTGRSPPSDDEEDARAEEAEPADTSSTSGSTDGSEASSDEEAPYKSKASDSGIGNEPGQRPRDTSGQPGDTSEAVEGESEAERRTRASTKDDAKSRAERIQRRRKRQSKLFSYVASDDYESITREDDEDESDHDDRTDETGAAAVKAVMDYERFHERNPEEMAHYNPGFDVISIDAAGGRRLIEVKGIDGEWNAVGVKLSRRQFRFAQDHPEEFWLYVVEHALDPTKRFVRPLRNPFPRVDGFLFDHEWRKACEAAASSQEMLVRIGANVDDWRWGRGVIVELMGRGLSQQAKVKFSIFGLKAIPISKLNIVD